MTFIQEVKYFGVAMCGGGLFLVFFLFVLPEHVPLLDVQTRIPQLEEKIETRLSASEYINQMGPWNKPAKIKEASAEPLK